MKIEKKFDFEYFEENNEHLFVSAFVNFTVCGVKRIIVGNFLKQVYGGMNETNTGFYSQYFKFRYLIRFRFGWNLKVWNDEDFN